MCINKTFVYGKSVSGDNFTDRIKETERLKMNFEAGMNCIIISPRRIGKTSLVRHAILTALKERELIEMHNDGTYDFADPVFKIWFRQNMM